MGHFAQCYDDTVYDMVSDSLKSYSRLPKKISPQHGVSAYSHSENQTNMNESALPSRRIQG